MPTIIVRHKVGDFNTWMKGHEERVKVFAPAVKSFKTFQDSNDPNSVSLVIDVTNLELLGSIMNDPKNQPLKDKHTVKEPIIMSIELNP